MKPAPLRFESLQASHIDAIMEIEKQVHPSPWSRQSFENEVGHKDGVFLVAFKGPAIVGYAGAWTIAEEAHVITVAVDPGQQRQGIGRRLVIELLERTKVKGTECATLEVRVSNEPAIALYESLDFISVGTRKKYYPDNREDALVMWKYSL